MELTRSVSKFFAVLLPVLMVGCGGGSSNRGSSPAPVVKPTATVRPTVQPTLQPTLQPTAKPVALRLACVGDSITAGVGTSNSTTNSFPALLSQNLGSGYAVRNFGVSGATVSPRGFSYRGQANCQLALNFKPNLLIIALGTNDTLLFGARQQTRAEFLRDYQSLVNAFKKANPSVKIYCCLPVPAYPPTGDKDAILQNTVNPIVREVARSEGATLLDLYTPLRNHPEFFPDGLHPNDAGARAMADEIFRGLTGKVLGDAVR